MILPWSRFNNKVHVPSPIFIGVDVIPIALFKVLFKAMVSSVSLSICEEKASAPERAI